MADAAEVKVKLVVDSNAEKATESLKKGLEGVGAAATRTHGRVDFGLKSNATSLLSLGKAAAGMVAGGFAAAAAAAVGLGVAGAHAFMEDAKAVKTLAGTFTMLSGDSGKSFESMKFAAKAVKDELENTAIAIGATDDALVDTFNTIMERGGKSVDQAMALTESFAQAGRALPGGAAEIGEAFAGIEMGIIRPRNAIVQMISATGLLKGNARTVAAEMMKMSDVDRIALAEKAIARMGEKMKAVPMSFGEMATSIKGTMSQALEAVGEPILKALTPVVRKVQAFFSENRATINAIGEEFGATFGQVIEVAGPILDAVFKEVRASSGDFKKAFAEFYAPAKELFSYIYENRGAFAKTLVDVAKVIVQVAAGLVSAMVAVRDTVMGILGKIADVVPGLGKFRGEEKQRGIGEEVRAGVAELGPGERMSTERIDAMRASYVKAGELADNVATAGADFDTQYRRAMDQHKATLDAVGAARDATLADDAAKYAAMFDVAANAHDKGAQKYVAALLEGNQSMQNVLVKAGPEIFKTGVDGFLAALTEAGKGDIAEDLRKRFARGVVGAEGEKGKGVGPFNFSGPITIKQDFRDQDPDRIAVVFREDLAKRAASRIGPRGGGPIGPFG